MKNCIGLGNYQLSSEFQTAARSLDEIALIRCYSPQELVEKLKDAPLCKSKQCSLNSDSLTSINTEIGNKHQNISQEKETVTNGMYM